MGAAVAGYYEGVGAGAVFGFVGEIEGVVELGGGAVEEGGEGGGTEHVEEGGSLGGDC